MELLNIFEEGSFNSEEEVEKYISEYSMQEVFPHVLNLAKTATVLNCSYEEFLDEVSKILLEDVSIDLLSYMSEIEGLQKFAEAVLISHLISSGKGDFKDNNLLNWDKYYHDICIKVASNSKCLSRQIGSVLVKDKIIICSGYNGAPRGIPHCNERYLIDDKLIELVHDHNVEEIKKLEDLDYKVCPRQFLGFKSSKGLEWCVAGHSERNTLIQAARIGIATKGCKLYMSCGIPCGDCFIEIINAGIEEIICTKLEYYDDKAKYLHRHSDIKIRVFSHLK
jgi:dCMP deaminase